MRFCATLALAAAAVLTLTACSSEPGSIKDLTKTIEGLDLECTPAEKQEDGSQEATCGDVVSVLWFKNAAAERQSHTDTTDTFDGKQIGSAAIRGGEWRIVGMDSAMEKIAIEMDRELTVSGW
uniref:hypothetical protein n=1 Tax=Arthrobacter sp. TaxID=1667 RepID=UPI00159EBEE3|nr:hypothetical protein [Arthrobacter sp.]